MEIIRFMPQGETQSSCDLRAVMTAIVAILRRSWPHAVQVTPCDLKLPVTDRLFLEAALSLQDEGAIMYEAMLVGVEPRPCLRDTMLTRKGQVWGVPAIG